MELRFENAKKNTVVNSVKSSGKINDKDNNTEFAINSNQAVINEFKEKSFTAVMTFVTKL